MLADPRASDALVDDFAAQWLNLRRVAEVVVDPERYPNYDLTLMEAFKRETELFVGSTHTRGSQRARAAERRLHVRQREAGPALRDSWYLRQPLPARHAARHDQRGGLLARERCWRRPPIRIARRRCCGANSC